MNTIETALLWATRNVVRQAARAPRSTRQTPLRVLMVGYSGKRNAGTEVRTAEIIRQLRRDSSYLKDAEFSVLSLNPEASRPYYPADVRLVPLSTVYFDDLRRACTEHDLGILCEGSCLKSVTSNAAALFFIAAAGIFAAQNKPCIGVGVEAGRMEPAVERAARQLCKQALFLARSDASLALFQTLGLRAERGTDAAWSVVPASPTWALAELGRLGLPSSETPLVGIGLINPFNRPITPSIAKLVQTSISGDHSQRYNALYYYSRSPERERRYASYIAAVASAVRPLLDGPEGALPVLIEMEPNDAGCAEDLEKALGGRCLRISSRDYDGEQMAALLRSLSLLVTSRYHAHVLSMPAGVPCVAISKDERLTAIFSENGMPTLCIASDDSELATRLPELVTSAWQSRRSISASLRRLSERYLAQQLEMTSSVDTELDRFLATRPGTSPLALNPAQEGTDGVATYFCESYEAARQQFLGTLEQRKDERPPFQAVVRSVGPASERLHTDFVHFPARGQAGRLITLVAGTHGIEGYVGSMVLQVLVNELDLRQLPSDVGLLLVHAVNPHGLRYGRRVNRHNVDLNRAFLSNFPDPAEAAQGFALRPSFAGLLELLKRPKGELEHAIVRGQRKDPQALFYGGVEPQPEVQSFCEEYERVVAGYRSALLVDVHTGYGPRNTQSFGVRSDAKAAASWSRKLRLPLTCVGQRVVKSDGQGTLEGYQVDGGLLGYANDLHRRLGIGDDSLALFWEFGTLGDSSLRKLQSLMVLLSESRSWQAKQRKIRRRPFDDGMAALFYPRARDWRCNAYLGAKLVLSRLLFNQQLSMEQGSQEQEMESYAHAV